MDEATTIEDLRWQELQEARMMDEEKRRVKKALKKRTIKLSFFQKLSKHWIILAVATIFDIIGLIPGISVVIDFIFGLILWLYFVLKKTKGDNALIDVSLPILGGSVIDFFTGVMPTCIAATLIKIWFSK